MPTKNELIELWKKVLAQIELEVTPMIFGSIIAKTTPENLTDSTLDITCANEFIKGAIEKKYLNIVEEALQNVYGKKLNVKLHIKKDKLDVKEIEKAPLFSDQTAKEEEFLKEKLSKSGLFPKFTFENYIMGKSNQLAYAIATAVAQRPGEAYNPVFFYSSVGLGKTHLMQAIGNYILKNKPGTKVVYTTGESFTNELVDAIQSGKGKGKYASNDFRNKFRKADVFLIDDIQFIAGKDSTQEEFFHTFNTLYMAQKQIIITSDRPPKDFKNIEDRITSRFNSGIIADIQPPDIEMRMAILRRKRDENKDPLPNQVIDMIAELVTTNTRELEGAYLQVLTKTKTEGGEMSKESTANILGQTVKEEVTKPLNMNQILNAVCLYYSIKSADIKGKKRTKELVLPRQVAMYLIKDLTDTPYMTIGDFLGGRDHSTVMHGVTKMGDEVKKPGKIRQDVSNVKQIIYSG